MLSSLRIVRSWAADHEKKRRALLLQAKLLIAVLVLNGVLGVFSHFYTNATHFTNLRTLETLHHALEATRLAQVHFKTQVQEWKNVLLRGDEANDFEKYFSSFEEQERLTLRSLEEAQRLSTELGVDNGDIDSVLDHHRSLGVAYREGLKRLDAADPASHRRVDDHLRGIDRSLTVEIDQLADRLGIEGGRIHTRIEEQARDRSQFLGFAAFALVGIGFMLIVLFVANADVRRKD